MSRVNSTGGVVLFLVVAATRLLNERRDGEDGLFLCWRVRHGLFEKNLLENNRRFGISISLKDTDNLLRENIVRSDKENGRLAVRKLGVDLTGGKERIEDFYRPY